jgi:hypothetical protein
MYDGCAMDGWMDGCVMDGRVDVRMDVWMDV